MSYRAYHAGASSSDDQEFLDVVTKAEKSPQTKLVLKAHNIDMVPHGTFSAITITK